MSSDGVFLWIPQANLSSAGHYSCIASNAVGEKTKHTQLRVLGECWASPDPHHQTLQEGTPSFQNQPLSLSLLLLSFLLPLQEWQQKWAEEQPDLHSNPVRGQAFCTQAFLVTVHAQTVTVPPAGRKRTFRSKKQLDQKSPSSSSEPRRFWLNK